MQKLPAPRLQQVSSAQETPDTNQRAKKYDKPHMIIPDEDMAWALEQRPTVFKLWAECWRSDPYGSRWMPLKTTLGRENFKKAKKPLIDAGLFLFENRLTIVDGKRTYEWWVKSLHGCRSVYWKLKGIEVGIESTTQDEEDISSTDLGTENTEVGTENTEVGTENTEVGTENTTQPYLNSLAMRVSKTLINISVTSHKHFTNSLRIDERGEFLKFCLQKIIALRATGFEVHTDHSWIANHYEQYWEEFRSERTASNSTIDWTSHPNWFEWLNFMRSRGVPTFVALGEWLDRKTRRQIADWADERNLIWGAET